MKKLLIATTALVATAGMASADITISGSANAGYYSGLGNADAVTAIMLHQLLLDQAMFLVLHAVLQHQLKHILLQVSTQMQVSLLLCLAQLTMALHSLHQ